jgi:hypothetical protein
MFTNCCAALRSYIVPCLLGETPQRGSFPASAFFLEPYNCQYSVWIRAGRPGDRGSNPAEAKGLFL